MTVEELCNSLDLTPCVLADGQRKVTGGCAGDLLSWVMGRAQEGDAWVTIMSNQNIVAVAALTDVSCIILAEGVQPDPGVAETAQAKGVNILLSPMSPYSLCVRLGGQI